MRHLVHANEATIRTTDFNLQQRESTLTDVPTSTERPEKDLVISSQPEAGCGRLKRLADATTEELADAGRDAKAAVEWTAELETENRRLRAELRAARAFAADQTAKAEELARVNAFIRRENEEKATQQAEEMAKLRTELDSMKGSRDEATIKVREVEETEAARNAEHAREVRAWKSGFESAKQVQEAFAVKLKKLETDLAVESRLNAYFLANRHDESLLHWKLEVRDWLALIVSSFWPTGELHVVGSSVNGCGSRHSDLDLTLLIAGSEEKIHVNRK
ncbi:hypothetical protein AAVH_16185 [Aphelenchoides avenae]|nr:hypothetical protein AAVH_16185 [Aphelenchus avenae]